MARKKPRPSKPRLDFNTFYGGMFAEIGESIQQDIALVANLTRELEKAKHSLQVRTAEYLFLKYPTRNPVVLQLNPAAQPAEYVVYAYRRCPETGLTLPVFRHLTSRDVTGRVLTKDMAAKAVFVKPLHEYLYEQDQLNEG